MQKITLFLIIAILLSSFAFASDLVLDKSFETGKSLQNITSSNVNFLVPKFVKKLIGANGSIINEVIVREMNVNGKTFYLRIRYNDNRYVTDTLQIHYLFNNGILDTSSIKLYSLSEYDKTCMDKLDKIYTAGEKINYNNCKTGKSAKAKFSNVTIDKGMIVGYNYTKQKLTNGTILNISKPIYQWLPLETIDTKLSSTFLAIDDIEITSCYLEIFESGNYYLTQDIGFDGVDDNCIWITAGDVNLDCQSHRIYLNDPNHNHFGIGLQGFPVNITNCIIEGYDQSIELIEPYILANSNIYNNTFKNTKYGIYINNPGDMGSNEFYNNTFYNLTHSGIYVNNDWAVYPNNNFRYNNFTEICMDTDEDCAAIYLRNMHDDMTTGSIVQGNYFSNISGVGCITYDCVAIYLKENKFANITGNIFNNETIVSAIYMDDFSLSNQFWNQDIYLNSTGTGIRMFLGSDNNIIFNSNITNVGDTGVSIAIYSENITIVNSSYDDFEGNGEMLVAWWYRAYVNDTDGSPVQGASILAYNRVSNLINNLTTDSNGWTNLSYLIEKQLFEGESYYSNYTINATKNNYYFDSNLLNITDLHNFLNDTYTIEGPIINIILPTNTTYDNFPIPFNVSTKYVTDSCNYSLDGATKLMAQLNTSLYGASNTSMAEGSHYVSYTCNSSTGSRVNTDRVYFISDNVSTISSCNRINVSNTEYFFTKNILYVSTGICFNVTAHNITIDGRRYNLTSTFPNIGIGFFLDDVNNVTIRNITNSGNWEYVITAENCNYNVIHNLTFGKGGLTGKYGIILNNCSYNTIKNITTTGMSQRAIELANNSNYNLVDKVNITSSSGGAYGVHFQSSSYNNLTYFTGNDNTWSVRFTNATFNTANHISVIGGQEAFRMTSNSTGNFINNITSQGSLSLFYLYSGTYNNTISNLKANKFSSIGINIEESYGNYFYNISLYNGTNSELLAIKLSSSNNYFYNVIFNKTTSILSSISTTSENNTFVNLTLSNSGSTCLSLLSNNNIFINSTISACKDGISIIGNSSYFTNLTINNNTQYGITVGNTIGNFINQSRICNSTVRDIHGVNTSYLSFNNITCDTSNIVNCNNYCNSTVKSNTCTYSSGNWFIDCKDNCLITTPIDMLGNNITFNGTGLVKTNQTRLNFTSLIMYNYCGLIVYSIPI